MPERRELQTVQALRAAACLLVVLYHGLSQAFPATAVSWPNGSAGVDLFFVISGFVMVTASDRLCARPDGWRVFLRRRLLRIVPLYWTLTAAKLCVVFAAPALAAHTRPAAWNIAASFLFLPAADATGQIRPVLPVGWTLNFEMLFYALFALALAMHRRPLALVAPILAALALLGFWRRPDWPALGFLANGMVLEFAFGMAAGEAWRRGRLPQSRGIALLALGALALLIVPLTGPFRFLSWGLPALLVLIGALALESRVAVPRWLVASGDASYATYLSHPFVVAALARLGPLLPLVALPASLAAGWLVHTRLDRRLRYWLGGAGRPAPSLSQAAS